jgi:hypothetical protein
VLQRASGRRLAVTPLFAGALLGPGFERPPAPVLYFGREERVGIGGPHGTGETRATGMPSQLGSPQTGSSYQLESPGPRFFWLQGQGTFAFEGLLRLLRYGPRPVRDA